MAKGSRSGAQRYAALRKKRRKPAHQAPSFAPSRPAGPSAAPAESAPAESRPSARPSAPPAPAPVADSSRARAATHRPFADYAQHYRYVWADIRRIGVIVGLLLL